MITYVYRGTFKQISYFDVIVKYTVHQIIVVIELFLEKETLNNLKCGIILLFDVSSVLRLRPNLL